MLAGSEPSYLGSHMCGPYRRSLPLLLHMCFTFQSTRREIPLICILLRRVASPRKYPSSQPKVPSIFRLKSIPRCVQKFHAACPSYFLVSSLLLRSHTSAAESPPPLFMALLPDSPFSVLSSSVAISSSSSSLPEALSLFQLPTIFFLFWRPPPPPPAASPREAPEGGSSKVPIFRTPGETFPRRSFCAVPSLQTACSGESILGFFCPFSRRHYLLLEQSNSQEL